MFTISNSRLNAIFKHLLINPQLADDFNFRSEYFNVITTTKGHEDTTLDKLYDAMKLNMDKKGLPYSYDTMEISLFENIKPELSLAYNQPSCVDPEVVKKVEAMKLILRDTYEAIENSYSSLSPEFIEDDCFNLVSQQSWLRKLTAFQNATLTNVNEMSPAEFSQYMESLHNDLENKYAPPTQKSNVYTDFFDERLAIRISNKVFPSYMMPINDFLHGGFKSQTVTSFLTKTGGGKSTILFTIAADALRQGQNVAFFNLEMNDYEVNDNILSALCKTEPYSDIADSIDDKEFISKLRKDIPEGCGRLAIISDEDGRSDIKWLAHEVDNTERKIRNSTGNPEFRFNLIIVDYLFLMEPSRRISKDMKTHDVYTQVTKEFHKYCQRNDYAGITVFQGNRGAETKIANQEHLTLADIGDSYGATREIENTFSMVRYENPEDMNDGILLYPLKIRGYDREKYFFFAPYNYDYKCYDSINAKRIDISTDEEENETRKPGRPKKKEESFDLMDIGDAIDAVSELFGNMPGYTIYNMTQKSDMVKKCTWEDFKKMVESKGIELKKAKDLGSQNYTALNYKIKDALMCAYSLKNNLAKEISQSQIKISGQDLFK